MVYSAQIKNQARKLRSQGASILEIARDLQISKSTASLWVKDVRLNEELLTDLSTRVLVGLEKGRILQNNRRKLLQQKRDVKSRKSVDRVLRAADRDVWQCIAALLFWCEGSKQFSSVHFANSDPELIKSFLFALRRGFSIDESKFRVLIHLHQYHNERTQTGFWSQCTNIPPSQFQKAYLKPNTGKRKRKDYPGCVSIRYYDASLARELNALYHALANKMGAW